MPKYDYLKEYIHLNTFHGKSRKERLINEMQSKIVHDMYDDPANALVEINGTPQHLIIRRGDTVSNKRIHSLPNENFYIGDLIKFNNHYWIVTDLDLDDQIYQTGTMLPCNYLFRWQNENYDIIERWALVTRPYASDINFDKTITTLKTEFIVQMHSDDETRKLYIDDKLMMFKDGTAPATYIITATNNITDNFDSWEKGIIRFNIAYAGVLHPNDNVDLKVANYKDVQTRINIVPINELMVGETVQLQYSIYRNDVKIDALPTFLSSNHSVITIDENGVMTVHTFGYVNITVRYEDSSSVMSIRCVNAPPLAGKYIVITGSNTIKHTLSENYVGKLYNNGSPTLEDVNWILDDANVSDNFVSMNIVNGNEVNIKTKRDRKNIGKTIKLVCISLDGTAKQEKEIKIKGII